jgi:hypothetical protein
MPAAWTGLTRVVRRYGKQDAAMPAYLVRQLPPKLSPSLIENGTIQTGLLFHHLAMLLAIAPRRPGHVFYLQILNAYERVVLADRCTGLVQKVFSGICDVGVNLLDFGFRLFPVVAEPDLAAHAALVAHKALLMLYEAVERCNEAPVAQCGEPGNTDIDADGSCR